MSVIAPSAFSELDRSLHRLKDAAPRWARLPITQKIAALESIRDATSRESRRWAQTAAHAKGVAGTPQAGEEWISGPWALLYALNRYLTTLREIDTTGSPHIAPSRVRTRPDGQVVVDVFPNSIYDALLLSGVRAEVWMAPGVTPATLPETTGVWYRNAEPTPHVSLVLGAGNIAAIPALDVLYKLIADGSVCILKMNPVNDYLGPIFEDVFAPLIDDGYLQVAYGGAEVGAYLCAHDDVDDIHITGSDKTHDAIVFGTGPEGEERKRRNEPLLRKPITSELGNVSPTIVVPGPWSDADFRFQAEHIVTQKLHNDGFNCIASQVLIVPSAWDGTPKLLDAIEDVLRTLADRPAYYPGATNRHERLAGGHDTSHYGRSGDGFVSRSLAHADASKTDDVVFTVEAFASILGVTQLAGDTETYLARAVAFANETLWGTLGGNIIVHPKTMRTHADALDRAIAEMRFGCVAVNAWTGVGFLLAETTWGAFPGHALNDVRSGIGVVHNSHLFSRAQKSVVYGPFAPFPRSIFGYGATMLPKPPWFVTNRMAANVGEALCAFEAHPTPLRAAKIALLAMQA